MAFPDSERPEVQQGLEPLEYQAMNFETNGYKIHAAQILKKLSSIVKKANMPASA